jgi:hypothetical protein
MKTFANFIPAAALAANPVMAQKHDRPAQAERGWKDPSAAARYTPIPQDTGVLTPEVAPGVFMVAERLYQAIFVVTESVVSPPTIDPRLSKAIRATSNAICIASLTTPALRDMLVLPSRRICAISTNGPASRAPATSTTSPATTTRATGFSIRPGSCLSDQR